MDRILLIDAMNAIWRATTSFGPSRQHIICDLLDDACLHKALLPHCLCGAKWHEEKQKCYGELYGFIFNFFRNLRPQIQDGLPHKVFVALEGHPQFRYDLFPAYKAHRRIIKQCSKREAQDKFEFARDEIIRLLQYLPITMARAVDYEADDLIATLVENMKDEDLTVISNDSDYIQLLQKGYKRLTIYNPIKKTQMEAPDYPYVAGKALLGDKSDGIPGILKPKKAMQTIHNPKLFQEFLSSQENQANFNCNLQLIEFRQVPAEEIILQEGSRNFPVLKQEFERMDFQSIINDASWEKYVKTFDCITY